MGHGVKFGGIRIPDPQKAAAWGHETPVESYQDLTESLIAVTDLNYVGHLSYVKKDSAGTIEDKEREDTEALGGLEKNVWGKEQS